MGQVYRMGTRKPGKTKGSVKLKGIIAILLIVYLIYTLTAQYISIRRARAEENRIQGQIEQMIEENNRLEEELKEMQGDEYIEKVAREELGLIKPGEIMFIDVNYGKGSTGN